MADIPKKINKCHFRRVCLVNVSADNDVWRRPSGARVEGAPGLALSRTEARERAPETELVLDRPQHQHAQTVDGLCKQASGWSTVSVPHMCAHRPMAEKRGNRRCGVQIRAVVRDITAAAWTRFHRGGLEQRTLAVRAGPRMLSETRRERALLLISFRSCACHHLVFVVVWSKIVEGSDDTRPRTLEIEGFVQIPSRSEGPLRLVGRLGLGYAVGFGLC